MDDLQTPSKIQSNTEILDKSNYPVRETSTSNSFESLNNLESQMISQFREFKDVQNQLADAKAAAKFCK